MARSLGMAANLRQTLEQWVGCLSPESKVDAKSSLEWQIKRNFLIPPRESPMGEGCL